MNRLRAKMYLENVYKNTTNFRCETSISFLNQKEVPDTFADFLKKCSKNIYINLSSFDSFIKATIKKTGDTLILECPLFFF